MSLPFLLRLLLTLALLTSHAAAQTLTLQVVPPQGNPRTFSVETATTAAQRRQGLSGRHTLAAQGGMLFEFHPPRAQVCMWMKDTHLPLAALFADTHLNIVTIAIMTPHTTALHCSDPHTPIRYVLELHQHEAQGIPAGSRLQLTVDSRQLTVDS